MRERRGHRHGDEKKCEDVKGAKHLPLPRSLPRGNEKRAGAVPPKAIPAKVRGGFASGIASEEMVERFRDPKKSGNALSDQAASD